MKTSSSVKSDPSFTRARAILSSSALLNNFRILSAKAPGQRLLPMIKANGYGHGATFCARALAKEKNLDGFGVATLEEGEALRNECGDLLKSIRVVVFSDSSPWSSSMCDRMIRAQLTPVFSNLNSLETFLKRGDAEKLDYELEFNTGMNRLGIPFDAAKVSIELVSQTKKLPIGVFSHFAMSEAPKAELTQLQLKRFDSIRSQWMDRTGLQCFHLANSGAIWNAGTLGYLSKTQLVRPGISLYGVPPWAGCPLDGIKPVMTLEAPVIARYSLNKGESVGYGATFKAEQPTEIATLGVGYADGLIRSLSNKGQVFDVATGKVHRFSGIISMDLASIELAPGSDLKLGDGVRWMGEGIDAWKQAGFASAVPYELLTSVSARVERVYV